MAEVVVATLNVSFSADTTGAGGQLKLEIDDREDGLNNGETSFKPGDQPGFFLFKDDNVTLNTGPKASAGGITSEGSGTKDIDENITFSNSDSSTLNYPPQTAVTMEWLGKCYTISGTSVTPNSTLPGVDGSNLKMAANKKVIGILHVTYTTQGDLYRLRNVGEDIPEVVIFAIGTVT